jgi:hypothetical protein
VSVDVPEFVGGTTLEKITPLPATIPAVGPARPVLEGKAEIAGQVLALATGTSVEASVVGRLTRDVVLLDVAGQLFQTTLPEDALQEGGDKLPLVVLRGGDKPAFLLDRRTAEPASMPSARVDLSDAGSRLGAAVAAATKGQASAPPVVSTTPLLPAPPADSHGLVPPLRQAVEGSGLFYESHQAEWVAGRRTLDTLRTEPQAVAGRLAALADEDSASQNAPRADITPARPVDGASMESRLPTDATAAPVPAIAQLVDRQLQTLSGQPIVWTGQVWPGQSMEWQIEEDRSEDAAEVASQAWTSKLRLTLPNLGEVELRVGLRDERLSVRVVSGAEHVASFRESAEVLRNALSARGLSLTNLEVAPVGDDA